MIKKQRDAGVTRVVVMYSLLLQKWARFGFEYLGVLDVSRFSADPVMPTNLVTGEGSGMALGSSLAYTHAVFVRPNGNWPHGERGGDSVVAPES
jgi:hypothetical protein